MLHVNLYSNTENAIWLMGFGADLDNRRTQNRSCRVGIILVLATVDALHEKYYNYIIIIIYTIIDL
jgi:hypothetical protein